MIERNIPCVRGNHDRWALGQGRADSPCATDGQELDATGWDLSGRALRYLASLPESLHFVEDGVRFHVCHGSPRSDMDGVCPDRPSTATLEESLDRGNHADIPIIATLEESLDRGNHTEIPIIATLEASLDDCTAPDTLVMATFDGSPDDSTYRDMPNIATLEAWLDDCQADVIIVGHTHMPIMRGVGRDKHVVNPGAVLRDPGTPLEAPMILDPKTGKLVQGTLVLGTFGVFDTSKRSFVVRRVTDGKPVSWASRP